MMSRKKRKNIVKKDTPGMGANKMFGKKGGLVFKVKICVEEDGDRFYAYCPSLKGLHIDGETEHEAIENAKETAVLYIMSLIKHGDPIPIDIVHTKTIDESPCEKCLPKQSYIEEDIFVKDVSLALG